MKLHVTPHQSAPEGGRRPTREGAARRERTGATDIEGDKDTQARIRLTASKL